MKLFTLKRVTVPASNETRQIEAVQLWEVRWSSRHGRYFGDTREEMEAFPTREAAQHFADSLAQAFRLIRHTSGTQVKLEKGKEI